jgi:hypothetical protein
MIEISIGLHKFAGIKTKFEFKSKLILNYKLKQKIKENRKQ